MKNILLKIKEKNIVFVMLAICTMIVMMFDFTFRYFLGSYPYADRWIILISMIALGLYFVIEIVAKIVDIKKSKNKSDIMLLIYACLGLVANVAIIINFCLDIPMYTYAHNVTNLYYLILMLYTIVVLCIKTYGKQFKQYLKASPIILALIGIIVTQAMLIEKFDSYSIALWSIIFLTLAIWFVVGLNNAKLQRKIATSLGIVAIFMYLAMSIYCAVRYVDANDSNIGLILLTFSALGLLIFVLQKIYDLKGKSYFNIIMLGMIFGITLYCLLSVQFGKFNTVPSLQNISKLVTIFSASISLYLITFVGNCLLKVFKNKGFLPTTKTWSYYLYAVITLTIESCFIINTIRALQANFFKGFYSACLFFIIHIALVMVVLGVAKLVQILRRKSIEVK